MKLIGTAGHVDHGKSALVLALTGTDPDRLPQEKARGMTIELGFALLRLPSGLEAGIVDVPGHERFVRTMVAGASGIDLALLVVAANEGLMPQTREHLAIIDLLGIRHGVVALTKSDTVSEEAIGAVLESVAEALAATTLAGAPVLACSAKTRDGLEGLLDAIDAQLSLAPERVARGRPRLPIDRAFTMPGFGPVVTGTLAGGELSIGQEIEIVPGGLRGRIRGLQNHGRQIDLAPPGARTAVNIAGIALDDLRRGSVVSLPGIVTAVHAVDVWLRAVPGPDAPLSHNLNVGFLAGTAETRAKLLLLESDQVPAGETAWAQLRFEEPIALLSGDRFIIRGPNRTLGGGAVVAIDPPRHRRHDRQTVAALDARLRPDSVGGMVQALAAVCEASYRIHDELAAYHSTHPGRGGMPREELRRAVGLESRAFDSLLESMVISNEVREARSLIALQSHAPQLEIADRRAAQDYLDSLRAAPYGPPLDGRPSPDVMEYMLASGKIVRAGDVIFAAEAYEQMQAAVIERLRTEGSVTLAQVRDIFGTSRRYAQAVLEKMDADRLTKRVGEARVLRNGE